MELETIKTKITALESKVKTKQDEINKLGEEKAQFEQKVQSLNDEIQRLEQDNANKREEIKKYKTVVEIMEL
jgi:peptidoglycan hydrolase CwlO-like protein|nr:MAG TPA: centrome localization domain protein [Caudoviricetes sp.]